MQNLKLNHFSIHGYRSIQELKNFDAKQINVLIGPNGAGKSNFITFFRLLSYMLNSGGNLQARITELGGASDLLHDGPDRTVAVESTIRISTSAGINEYEFALQFAKPDRLMFAKERFRFISKSADEIDISWTDLGKGHLEAILPTLTNRTANTIWNLIKQFIVYQFHNTSDTAGMRLRWDTEDGRHLKANGQNLGSFLLYMQHNDPQYYVRVAKYVQGVLPFFQDFELHDEFGKVMLKWKEKGSQRTFNAGQASDGMLRIIALVALLSQNPKNLPAVLFLDEPELGLHPKAIELLAALIKAASHHCQLFVATQSVTLVDEFEPDDLVIIERKERGSSYTRPDVGALTLYLEEFSMGEIWEKNVIGGRP